METGLTKQRIIAELTRSEHGELKQYVPVAEVAAKQEAEFFAHLIAWNYNKGEIRDTKVALPVVSLREPSFDKELLENSLAHLAMLDPRNLVRALRFGKEIKTPQRGRQITAMVERYLRTREAHFGFWEGACIQHRDSMRTLYALAHIKPGSDLHNVCLFGRHLDAPHAKAAPPAGTKFDAVRRLKTMPAQEAAGTIMRLKIPFLVAVGALGARAKETDLVLALIGAMSPAELVTNTKMLERLGVKTVPELRAAYAEGLRKVASAPKAVSTFKTTRAAEASGDAQIKEKLRGVQEKQLDKLSVDGNWLVLADKSSSMSVSIELGRQLSATLARMVKGDVHLIFFDSMPRYINASGKAYDELVRETARIQANGMTGIGCGLQMILEKGIEVDGIAIVSDGGENQHPAFCAAYKAYERRFEKSPPVYLYHVAGDRNVLVENNAASGIDTQVFEIGASTDYYSLPAIVATMRAQRYGLVEQIMDTPLRTLDSVFKEAA